MGNPIFKAFVDRWLPENGTAPVSTARIDDLSDYLGATLPETYREFLVTVGAASMPLTLLSTIVDQRLDITNVQDFYDPEAVMSITRDWRQMGLPENLYAIASDGAGNQFCFAIPDLGDEIDSDPYVWFFDHEDAEAYDSKVPFTSWIETFANIEDKAR